jgi:uncharacterized protein
MSSGPRRPRRPADLATAAMTWPLRLGPRRNRITVDRGLRVPMRDGTLLLADHYAPVTAEPRPTVLLRTPYGRGPNFAMMARPYAERGYHVLLQSARGTFGSGGTFTPAVSEAADGHDTVAWLRGQPWFNGKLVVTGPSYLAFAAWALALDPPPELTAVAVQISPHDLASAGFGRGPFELFNLLSWSDLMASQERFGAARMMWRTMTAERRLAAAMDRLPVAASGTELADRTPWYLDWFAHADRGDPYWAEYSAAAALERITVPTLLISGWHDFFAEQTMAQYQVLRDRGVPVGLTVGPWTHMTLDMGLAIRETLAWFDAYADGNAPASPPRPTAVRVWTSGANVWRDLPSWPPAVSGQPFYLRADGGLGTALPTAAEREVTSFQSDPAHPTPGVGGRLMSVRGGGSVDNGAVEARADVLTFSTDPLPTPVEVAGVPVVRLFVSSDNPNHDLFVRLCDVDPRGRSRNLTDQIVRFTPTEAEPGQIRDVEIALTDISHVFAPAHQIRLQVSGGAHPRYARNLGTDVDPVHGSETAPVVHQVQHSDIRPSAIVLPVVSPLAVAEPAEDVAPGRAAGSEVTSALASQGPVS